MNACRFTLLVGLLAASLIACTSTYKPVSTWEREEYEKAIKDVYPEDVRRESGAHSATQVVWPGILLESSIQETPDGLLMSLLVEHHYYDWLEDSGAQREKYFLSKRGEGQFRTTWLFRSTSNRSAVEREVTPGSMVIAYGTPESVVDGVIILKSTYLRHIPKRLYHTQWDYGR